MRYLIAAYVLALFGCATPEQIGARNAEYALQNWGGYCDKLGFKRDTDEFRNCVIQASRR